MDKETKNFLFKTITVFLIVVTVGIFSWSYFVYRQAQNIVSPERTISFSAEGKVLVKSDIATINFSVVTQGEKAELVQKENNEKMKTALDFVKSQGIKDEDIKTVQYSLSPQYDYTWCQKEKTHYISCPPKIIGYLFNQSVEVKIRNFDKISDIVGGLTKSGINDISQVSFEIEDLEEYKNQARIEAIKKIEKRAKLFSQSTSIKLGRILDISESSNNYPLYRQEMKTPDSREVVSSTAPAPIEAGTEEIAISLTVKYELK